MQRKYQILWLTVLILLLLALGAFHGFDIRFGHYGTGDWLGYWSFPRSLFFGYGYFNLEWLEQTQSTLGYDSRYAVTTEYPVIPLWIPPPLAILLMPLGASDFTSGTLLWLGLSTVLYTHATSLFNRTLPQPLSEYLVIALSYLFLPFMFAMMWGQITPFLVACLIYAWLAQRQGQQIATGILLVPLLFKPHLFSLTLVLLLLVVFRRGEMRTLLSGGSMLTLLVLGAFLLDPTWLSGWLVQGLPSRQTFSLLDVVAGLLSLPQWVPLLGLLLAMMVALVRYWRIEKLTPYLLAEATLLSVLFSPHLWYHDLVVILPTALWLAHQLWYLRLRWPLFLGTLLWWLPYINIHWLNVVLESHQSPLDNLLQTFLWLIKFQIFIRFFLYLFIFILLWLWIIRKTPPKTDYAINQRR